MKSIYRLRPSHCFTLEELENNYLWFSKPTEYKDTEDSNVIAFLEKNESINKCFNRVFRSAEYIASLASHNGICCFTASLPLQRKWSKFPKAHNGICIEYDKDCLDNYFLNKGFGNAFKPIIYIDEPLTLNYTEEEILEFSRDSKKMEKVFEKMFTRLNTRYKIQNEQRIIIGAHRVNDNIGKTCATGYEISIPNVSIKNIYITKSTDKEFVCKLRKLVKDQIPIKNI